MTDCVTGIVTAVSRSPTHSFTKEVRAHILLIAGLGVADDAHAGRTVKHRSRVARDPTQPNLRQVHLVHQELHEQLRAEGFDVSPGQMGENITTIGVPLLELPSGTRLRFGEAAVVELTGLRNPCSQLDGLQSGLKTAVVARDAHGNLVRKAGVMGVVISGGEVRAGDRIHVELPPEPHLPLRVV